MTKYVVSVKPGSAAEQSLRFDLKEDQGQLKFSIREAVTHGLGLNFGRKQQRAADAIRGEMNGDYGVTVNGAAVAAGEPIEGYFADKEHKGVPYKAVDITIASKQLGGLEGALHE